MCAEILSWREESWWERKSIPLGSHSFSPRQLFLLGVFGTIGELMAIPVPVTVWGIIYVAKLIPVLALLAIGFALGSFRIKAIPLEFQLFFKVSKNKDLRITNSGEVGWLHTLQVWLRKPVVATWARKIGKSKGEEVDSQKS